MLQANAEVQRAIDEAIRSRGEVGLQVAAYLDGALVVDAWGGLADAASARPVDGDTLFTVFSATKAIAATALHIQADRGLVEYDAPIASYWPEFAANGKQATTVRHALHHEAGVPPVPAGATPESICDWDAMVSAVAGHAPLWEAGTRSGYHNYTFGWLIGEIVRRTDPAHRPFGQFVQDEVCRPLSIDGLWLGIPDAAEPRVATLLNPAPPPAGAPPPTVDVAIRDQATPPNLALNGDNFNRPDVRRACLPGVGGIMNARSLARFYAMLAGGGELDGVRLLSPERVEMIRGTQIEVADVIFGRSAYRGLGYMYIDPVAAGLDASAGLYRVLGHPGAGGSIGWMDPESGLAVAILKNRMLNVPTADANPVTALARAVRDALGVRA